MKNTIPNLLHACKALKLVASSREGLSTAAVAAGTGASPSSTFRLLTSLCVEGFLTKDERQYKLGPVLVELGLRALEQVSVRDSAAPVLRQLADASGETAHVAIPAGYASLILEVCDSPNPIRAASRPGSLAALHCSSTGKVFLAWLHGDVIADVLAAAPPERRTKRTLVRASDLAAEVKRIRARGWAVDDEEHHDGVRCLAAPVRDPQGHVVAAIGITGSAARLPRARDAEMARKVVAAANALERRLRGAPEVAA